MSYQDKLDAARVLIEGHNNSLGNDAGSINYEAFVTKLKEMGGTSLQALSACSWDDLKEAGLPIIQARAVAKIFRSDEKPEAAAPVVIIDDDPVKMAARLKPAELINHYDPDEPDNPFGERLAKLAKGRNVLVFDNDSTLNCTASAIELQRVRDGYDSRETTIVDGQVRQTYQVGNRPGKFASEHPLFPGKPLNMDGTSDAGLAWASLDLAISQLVYLAVDETGELSTDYYAEHDVFDMVEGKTFDRVATRYPRAAAAFKELKDLGTLPQLKIAIGGSTPVGGQKKNDPWRGNRST